MNDFADVLDTLIPLVGGAIVDKAKDEITKLSEDADDPRTSRPTVKGGWPEG